MGQYRGVFPAVITPMTKDDQLDEAALRQVLEFNIKAGVHGFWIAGGTGESVLLDDDENLRIAEIAADQNQGRILNIMHVGAPTTKRAAAMAQKAAAAGVDAICCVPPFFYRRSDDEIVEHYRAVAAAADLPFFAYNLPGSTGVTITTELMAKIKERVPQMTGLKHSVADLRTLWNFVQMDLACFVGSAGLMLPAMTLGAVGCVDGPPCLAPELWLAIWTAYQAGDLAKATAAQNQALRFLTLFDGSCGSYLAVVKQLLGQRLGIDCGPPRLPGQPQTDAQRQAAHKRATELGLVV